MDKKRQYLPQAWQLFNQNGFHATGVEEIRQQLNITKKTLYRYFSSKEQLIIEVLQYRNQVFLQKLSEFMQNHNGHAAMLRYLDFLQDWVQQADFYGCNFINACAEYSHVNSAPHQIAQQHKKNIEQILASHQIEQPYLDQIFTVGEGLIVSSQVMGYNEQVFLNLKKLFL
ncbi:TetR/AcrR family transcriptional regulator [Acinetobacter qingfengensis]|uniref:HTH tetR-type domain-containing protein n=1 Tax=Acinetobacter qingfengensis TaxID=1262585 RepID=A0A1E7QZ29_9GAMM|nr:TetR/AcrR family transcriptional regulator [Acinetobacter qingfengensis]OEY92301.1 hypothetical protein BJI46_06035 [Acinetobacter qingfengensis]